MGLQDEFISRIEKHQGILHKISFMYARTKADQEDLYQEMILQLWKSYPSYQGKSAFSTWMYRVALNTAITRNKKERLFMDSGNEQLPVIDPELT
ncbi:MAG: RNA polymerase sigma factor, partial [Cyclobacteriaceae bacterium]